MSRLVRPQTLRGFRDLLPAEMLLRNEVVDRIRRVYESYGFVPLDTPVLESLPALVGSGGAEADQQIFHVREAGAEKGADGVGMRFDLTVPFARIIAQYHPQQVRLPFRRYHIGPVFRADEPQPEQGRFRQFTQFDCDIAGSSAVAADAEIVAVMAAALESLGLRPVGADSMGTAGADGPGTAGEDGAAPVGADSVGTAGADSAGTAGAGGVGTASAGGVGTASAGGGGFYLRVNNRKLVDAFLAGLGITVPAVAHHVLRVLDKADKISAGALRAELGEGRFDVSGDRIAGVGLDQAVIDSILEFAAVREGTRAEVVDALATRLPAGEQASTALAEVRELLAHLDALGVGEGAARFDPSLARGLAYYTGTVYEGTLAGAGVGSVIGGGRYDGLVSRFSDEPVAAVGASIGLDRLITGLRNLGVELGTSATTAQVVVLVMPGVDATAASGAAHELRRSGIPTELYVGESVGKVGKQLAYANAQGFRAAVMIGSNELRDGTVTVKDLHAGNQARTAITDNKAFRSAGSTGQQVVPRADLTGAVRAVLATGTPDASGNANSTGAGR